MEKNVGQRLIVILVVVVVAALLLWPPQQKLRPGLDIAGGTSLIFEIDTTAAEGDATLAERVKEHLQKRVDPKGVYDLSWRVQGRSRIEVQMPLPPRDAKARLSAYRDSLDALYSHEIGRGPIQRALAAGPQRDEQLRTLARRQADAALAALDEFAAAQAIQDNTGREAALRALGERIGPAALAALVEAKPEDVARRRDDVVQGVANRETLLVELAARYDTFLEAEATHKRGPVASQPTTDATSSAPAELPMSQEALDLVLRDASELFEDAMQEVLGTNLNRRRFEEVLELEQRSPVRQNSLEQVKRRHADLCDAIEEVLAHFADWRSGKHFLEGPADLKRLLRGSGRLEFRILTQPDVGNPAKYNSFRQQLKEEGRERLPGTGYGWFRVDNPMQFFNLDSQAVLEEYRYEESDRYVIEKFDQKYYVLAKTSSEDGLLQGDPTQRKWQLVRARPDRDSRGQLSVSFTLDIVGGQMFERLTRQNIDKPLCILVDDIAYSAPNIQSAIRTQGQITGDFSPDKINYLVRSMEGGTLPARLKDTPLSERTVGSSLGEVNRDNALRAGLYGGIAVVVVMIGYYWICGSVATVALLLNILFLLSAMAMLGARVTLVGIGGIILSVGMAVDANVLIYERMREEKERGASLRMTIKNGYDKALSTIFDSNITTLLTCVIIYYVGSEEVKGFGLTLGWGIVLNLFTSIFVTRTLFMVLTKYNLIKDIKMARLIGVPKIDWYAKRKIFIPLSVLFLVIGLGLLVQRGARNVLDVEFLGGVAAEFGVKESASAAGQLDDTIISAKLQEVGRAVEEDIKRLANATVEPAPDTPGAFMVSVDGVNADRLVALIAEPLEDIKIKEDVGGGRKVEHPLLQRGGAVADPDGRRVRLFVQGAVPLEQVTSLVHDLATDKDDVGQAGLGDNLTRASVNSVLEIGGVAQAGTTWNITTTVTNMRLVQYALESALGDRMDVQPSVDYIFRGEDEQPFPATNRLPEPVRADLPAGVNIDLTDFLGGAAMYFDQLDPPQTIAGLTDRLDNMHFQPDFQDLPKRRFEVFGVKPAEASDENGDPLYSAVLVASVDPEIRYSDDPKQWFEEFAKGELTLVKTALASEQTLRKVMQFKPQIASRSTEQASLALLLSWAMIIGYLWIRFGRPAYGLAGVVALIHDALIALAFIGISGWIGGKDHPLGQALLISDFKINMTIVAALLTIIGYSINDTIVVFDRIRETRGRLGEVTPDVINASINQTLSRTLMTSFTTLVVLLIMYIWGGNSIRGFNACMMIGVLTGSYSSIAIAAPLLMLRLAGRGGGPRARAT